MSLLLNRLNHKNENSQIPIWIMRQAGRYLPEYRDLRKKFSNFLDFCYTPDAVLEATLQPIKRYDLDAAIIFSDILIIPDALGLQVTFKEQEGPLVEKIMRDTDLQKLSLDRIEEYLSPVFTAIKNVKAELPENKALIGFCGAPWTIACYIISGRNHQNFYETKKMMFAQPELFSKIINLITDAIIICLKAQIKAGIDVIQIFDSWAGLLPPQEFHQYSIKPTEKIISEIRKTSPNIPIIGFPRGAGSKMIDYAKITRITALQCDETTEMKKIAATLPEVILQGNLDPLILLGDNQQLITNLHRLLGNMKDYPFIFNLGHGISKETEPDKVQILIDTIRNYKN